MRNDRWFVAITAALLPIGTTTTAATAGTRTGIRGVTWQAGDGPGHRFSG
ncbi:MULTISPECIES: hypothetical protein [unclassified Streptomyces]|nr:hypothetical protein [Streptomyces sp. NBC_00566]WUB90520.1 hypothetical protein OG812_29710 [Streptomyces sp. NBC_00566]